MKESTFLMVGGAYAKALGWEGRRVSKRKVPSYEAGKLFRGAMVKDAGLDPENTGKLLSGEPGLKGLWTRSCCSCWVEPWRQHSQATEGDVGEADKNAAACILPLVWAGLSAWIWA